MSATPKRIDLAGSQLRRLRPLELLEAIVVTSKARAMHVATDKHTGEKRLLCGACAPEGAR